MMVLVIGGSGSGKSACAEELADALGRECGGKKYYLATMRIFGEEGRRKVERHRRQRAGRGYLTIEQPVKICGALEQMEAGERVVLLECILNLTANEMFSGEVPEAGAQTAQRILRDIRILRENTKHLVVVSGNVFEDGTEYDAATMEYIRAVGGINRSLAALADRVIETVVGIPIVLKEQ